MTGVETRPGHVGSKLWPAGEGMASAFPDAQSHRRQAPQCRGEGNPMGGCPTKYPLVTTLDGPWATGVERRWGQQARA
jgi:hypothetical protein